MMLELTEIRDVETLNAIIRHPDIYPEVSDDSSPKPENFTMETLTADPLNLFYLVTLGGETCGFFAFLHGELHTSMLRLCRGRMAVTAGRMAVDKFQREHIQPITSFAWEEEPHTLWYANALGFSRTGEKSIHPFTRNGQKLTRINLRKDHPCHS